MAYDRQKREENVRTAACSTVCGGSTCDCPCNFVRYPPPHVSSTEASRGVDEKLHVDDDRAMSSLYVNLKIRPILDVLPPQILILNSYIKLSQAV